MIEGSLQSPQRPTIQLPAARDGGAVPLGPPNELHHQGHHGRIQQSDLADVADDRGEPRRARTISSANKPITSFSFSRERALRETH